MKYTGCLGRAEIVALKTRPVPNCVLVSLRDPGSPIPKVAPDFESVIYLEFWDVVNHDYWDFGANQPASLSQLTALYRFLKEHEGRSIIAHCEAGISRSAAVREFLIRRGWKFFEASQAYRQVHPNSHVLSVLERLDKGLSPGDAKEYVWPSAPAPDVAGPNGG